jgi:hypothetical protein
VARHLARHRDLTVITNSIPVAQLCAENPTAITYVVGGKLVPGSLSMIGPGAERDLAQISADWAFIGAAAVDVHGGFTSADPYEAQVKRAMIRAARNAVIVADATKFGTRRFSTFARADDIAHVVTTTDCPEDVRAWLDGAGVGLTLCEPGRRAARRDGLAPPSWVTPARASPDGAPHLTGRPACLKLRRSASSTPRPPPSTSSAASCASASRAPGSSTCSTIRSCRARRQRRRSCGGGAALARLCPHGLGARRGSRAQRLLVDRGALRPRPARHPAEIVRVDARMAREAVSRGTRIAVIATLQTTLRPTGAVIAETAQATGRMIALTTRLVEGAYAALMAGDQARHDDLVTDAIAAAAADNDVVVLAQASMARVLPRLPADRQAGCSRARPLRSRTWRSA